MSLNIVRLHNYNYDNLKLKINIIDLCFFRKSKEQCSMMTHDADLIKK